MQRDPTVFDATEAPGVLSAARGFPDQRIVSESSGPHDCRELQRDERSGAVVARPQSGERLGEHLAHPARHGVRPEDQSARPSADASVQGECDAAACDRRRLQRVQPERGPGDQHDLRAELAQSDSNHGRPVAQAGVSARALAPRAALRRLEK